MESLNEATRLRLMNRRSSLCSTRIGDIAVDNLVYQNQIETLKWQLKQTESSREMYRALMKQVVVFLEKAHQNLGLLGHQFNQTEQIYNNSHIYDTLNFDSADSPQDTWKRKKKHLIDEARPEKLSQEAFRLLRMAHSLLNTNEPDLVQRTPRHEEDSDFIKQLAKEFPQIRNQPQRTNSFTAPPPKEDCKTSRPFTRKLSLQGSSYKPPDFSKLSNEQSCASLFRNLKLHQESQSLAGSIGAESGFSSMSSYQEDFDKDKETSSRDEKTGSLKILWV